MPEKSFQGQLLVASRLLRDPNFARTVVLLVQHGEQGAFGLVLNRPLELSVQSACEEVLEKTCKVEGVLHSGGPCDGVVMVLHTNREAGEFEVVPGIFFSTERDKIEWLLENHRGSARYYVGYAGWGAGQLEMELSTGSWILGDTATPSVLDAAPELWQKLMTQLTVGRWIRADQIPDDPSMN